MAQFDWRNPDFSVQLLGDNVAPPQLPAYKQRTSEYVKALPTAEEQPMYESKTGRHWKKRIPLTEKAKWLAKNHPYNGYSRRHAFTNDLDRYITTQEDMLNTLLNASSHELSQYGIAPWEVELYKKYTSPGGKGLDAYLKAYEEEAAKLKNQSNSASKQAKRVNTEPISSMTNQAPPSNTALIGSKSTTARTNYDGMSFNSAFAAARKAGLDKFNWRGKDYTTELAGSRGSSRKRTSAKEASVPMPTIGPIPMDRAYNPADVLLQSYTPAAAMASYQADAGLRRAAMQPTTVNLNGVHVPQYGWGGWLLPIGPYE